MHKILLILLLLWPQAFWAQTLLRQQRLSRWKVMPANYSGITPLDSGRYALVSDKEPADGFHVLRIRQHPRTGRVEQVTVEGFRGNKRPILDRRGHTVRDCEGIVYVPACRTLFISGEGDQQVLEYDMEGQPTGRALAVPDIFARHHIVGNAGFEALAYHGATGTLWTMTERALPADSAEQPANGGQLLRLQSFADDLQPACQFAYLTDLPLVERRGRWYVHGVSALCALEDGRLLVLERELSIPARYFGATCRSKVYAVSPPLALSEKTAGPGSFALEKALPKTLLTEFKTSLSPLRNSFANYEGMCLGIRLEDGRQTVLLINDSQAAAGKGPIHLRDYIRVLILPPGY